MARFTNFLMAFALLPASAGSALSQSADPAWLEKLNQQLARDQKCEVEYYVNLREGKLGGFNTYAARAQCRDGRQFDTDH